jgi:hypothetical protein
MMYCASWAQRTKVVKTRTNYTGPNQRSRTGAISHGALKHKSITRKGIEVRRLNMLCAIGSEFWAPEHDVQCQCGGCCRLAIAL